MMMGYMYGGKEGMMYAAAANHLMQDLMSDTLIRTVGYAGRDLFEATLNYGLVNSSRKSSNNNKYCNRREH
jgi:hypothetical protein